MVPTPSYDRTRSAKCIEAARRIRWDIDRETMRGRQVDRRTVLGRTLDALCSWLLRADAGEPAAQSQDHSHTQAQTADTDRTRLSA